MSEHDADAVVERILVGVYPRLTHGDAQYILSALRPGDDLGSGLVAVPREPTEAMYAKFMESAVKQYGAVPGPGSKRLFDVDYRAMIAAAAA